MTLTDEQRKELRELIWTAKWAAGKLDVSMIRGEVGRRAEFEALVNAEDLLRKWLRLLEQHP